MPLKPIPIRTLVSSALMFTAAFAASTAQAFIYTVGKSGLGNNCSFATIQQAINAASANNTADEIWITRDVAGGYYPNQALTIPAQRHALKLVGGFDNCWDGSPSGMTELHGNGGARAPVLDIVGGNVTLQGLRLTRGDADLSADQAGGGLRLSGGSGLISIIDSLIDNNRAGRGGGIAFRAVAGSSLQMNNTTIQSNHATTVGGGILLDSQGSSAALTGYDNVRIISNYAAEGGGGIAMTKNSMLTLNGRGLQVEANGTSGNGGAVLAVSPVTIHVGASPVAGTLGTFVANEAWNGAVFALTSHPRLGTSTGRSIVTLSSADFGNPQVFRDNYAHRHGGVVWIDRPGTPNPADHVTKVCAWNVAMDGNHALGGSAIALNGAGALYDQAPDCSISQTHCAHAACNRVNGNATVLDGGQPYASGSLYDVSAGAVMRLARLRVEQNATPYVFLVANGNNAGLSSVNASELVVARNWGTSLLSQCGMPCLFQMTASTIAGNQWHGPVFENGDPNFFFTESIVDQPGRPLFAFDPLQFGGSPVANIVYDAVYSSSHASVRYGSPQFLNAAGGDYRLGSQSPALDAAPARAGIDVLGRPRTVDLPWRLDFLGPRDLGAIEMQANEFEMGIF